MHYNKYKRICTECRERSLTKSYFHICNKIPEQSFMVIRIRSVLAILVLSLLQLDMSNLVVWADGICYHKKNLISHQNFVGFSTWTQTEATIRKVLMTRRK